MTDGLTGVQEREGEFDTPFGSQPIETQVVDTTVTEFGIACEACHGPSGGHARSNRNPPRRYSLHAPHPSTGSDDGTAHAARRANVFAIQTHTHISRRGIEVLLARIGANMKAKWAPG